MNKKLSTLDELIEQGQIILGGIQYVKPPRNVMRLYSVYSLADSTLYYDWKNRTESFVHRLNDSFYLNKLQALIKSFEEEHFNPSCLKDILGLLKSLREDIDIQSMPHDNTIQTNSKKVFIVHGHSELHISQTESFLQRLGFEPVILRDQPSQGQTIIEKLESYTDVTFAIVLYTSCDKGGKNEDNANMKPRARQNVVFEHGYLNARLGRNRVCALVEEGVEIPSDLDGVVYICIDKKNFWKYEVAKEMKASGLDVDLNRL